MALRLNRMADELEKGAETYETIELPRASLDPKNVLMAGQNHLASVARSIHYARRRRDRWFEQGLFGEPAWDMLLDAFAHKVTGKQLTTKSISFASGVALTTALRWLNVLQEVGLIRRIPSQRDRRETIVELTDKGYRMMTLYLMDFGTYQKAASPKA